MTNQANKLDSLIGSYVYTSTPHKDAVGLEIECEGTNLCSRLLEHWRVVEDGSLRFYQGHPPQEYVLRNPLPSSELENALDYLIRRLSSPDTFIYSSPRTSVHVHLNAGYLTNKQVITWYCLYLILENVLSEWAGHDRVGNMFCLRVADSPTNLERLIENIQYKTISAWVPSEYRYSACNLHSLPKMGSLEFRQLSSTINKSRILQWVGMLQTIKNWSYVFDNPKEIMEKFTDPDVIIRELDVSAELSPLLADRSLTELRQELWQGLRLANELAYCISSWNEGKTTEKTEDDLDLPVPPPSLSSELDEFLYADIHSVADEEEEQDEF